jgi:hypothetical protein
MKSSLVVFILFISAFNKAEAAEKVVAASGKERVRLVELYSSESCSSCPPADQYASRFQDRKDLWKEFVPIVFHVDYWNHLNWKDELSSNEMTRRQYALAGKSPSGGPYTPEFFVDGQEWLSWRNEKVLPSTLQKSSDKKTIELSVSDLGGGLFHVKALGLIKGTTYVVRIAKLGMGIETDVNSGENSGRHLKHDFVLLEWDGKAFSSNESEATFTLKKEFKRAKRLAIAAWIEESNSADAVQAVGGWL